MRLVRSRGRGRGHHQPQDRRLRRGLPLLLAVGPVPVPVRAAWLDIPSLVKAAIETRATGATEFCIVAAVRGPDERLMTQIEAGITAIREAVDIQIACSLGHAHAGAGRRPRRDGRAPLQPQPRDGPLALPERRHHAHLGGALRDAPDGARGRHGGLLRRHPRHGRDPRAARRVRRAARGARARRGAAELPQPAPRHALRRPAGDGRATRRCRRSRSSAWPCRAPSCASPAAARSPSATWPRTACSAASTPSSSATT